LATATYATAGATPSTLDLRVLLVGDGPTDVTTAAWESALSNEGVPYTEVDATGATSTAETSTPTGSWTITLPALSSGTTGYFNGVVIADDPADFTSGQMTALDTYEATFGVRQVDGYAFPTPTIGETFVSGAALDGTTGALTAAGLTDFPELAGPIPFATGTYGYWSTTTAGAPFTPIIVNSAGDALAGIYQHPSTDPQSGVSELSLFFDYNSTQLQWLLLAPGLINWVTQGTHLGEYQNYVEMDIDDTFTPDDAWDTTTHEIDYADGDSLRMTPEDVITAAQWSQANNFRLDQLFNYGSTVAAQAGDLDFAGSTVDSGVAGPDPLLAQFQATDPKTAKSYADDFGWISHTYDTPYLDVGCATQNYIEAELNENTNTIAAASGATPGTGGLGITSSTNDALSYGYEDPQVFVPGNHSGFADLVPGNPATVDEPDLDQETASTGGTLAAGTYEYAVTDQFNGAAVTAGLGPDGESAAYVTAPITVPADGSVQLQWEAICHAANYNIYRAPVVGSVGGVGGTVGSWTLVGNYDTPFSATLPDNSSADTTGGSTTDVTGGGETELTFTDTGSSSAECQGDQGAVGDYCVTAGPAGWTTPPVDENAEELPWESNPYFVPAMQAAGITAVGSDASKPYPNPPDAQFGYGTNYTGATYAAGQTFLEGTPITGWPGAQVVPRHPINVYYNVSTDAQELDEYNSLFTPVADGGQCESSSNTTCETTPVTYPDIVNSVVSQMLQYMLTNNPEPSYVHQTNIIGILPGCTDTTWAANPNTCEDPSVLTSSCTAASCMPTTPDTAGDGTLYSVLDPLLTDYHSYFSALTPYVQLTEGQIATVLADQSAWSGTAASDVSATETNGVVTITNTGAALEVPVTVPTGTLVDNAAFGTPYGGALVGWTELGTGSTVVLGETVAPVITSAAAASSNVGAAFTFTVTTTGEPAPALSESGALPGGITFIDNGNGTATIAGTPTTSSGGTYPLVITAANAAGTTTQDFTLTNDEAPSITSADTATFTTTVPGTYTVTTTGFPAPAITEVGALPAGMTFTDNGNGTATLTGVPAATAAGQYPITVTATNAADDSLSMLDLVATVDPATAPTISTVTGTDAADFTLGQAGSFGFTTTGSPTPAITATAVTLPAGLSFTTTGGTALLYGTPTATGTVTFDVTASNGISPDATVPVTVVVGSAPAITSAPTATETTGIPFSLTVTTTGYPAPSIGESGLPADFTFHDNGNGTATIAGTPVMSDIGTYTVDISAVNGTATASQALTLTVVSGAPAITSSADPTFTAKTAGTFTVTATGTPAPALSETGALPAGVTFADNGNGTATLAGTPAEGTQGTYPLVITATNTSGTATEDLSLVVNSGLAITSTSSATATGGKAFSFTVTATGTPTPTLSHTGTLPSGVSFTAGTNGTATLAGTPSASASGVYAITFTAKNSTGTASQAFSLTVDQPPTYSNAATVTETAGTAFAFTVSTKGYPVPALSAGTLPSGVSFVDNGNGTGTLAGTTSVAAGTYSVTITAANAGGSANQVIALTVKTDSSKVPVPAFTSAATATATAGKAFTFTVTTTGSPTTTYSTSVTHTGTLPSGLSFNNLGNGTATISGTPTAASGGTYALTLTAKNSAGTTTQSFVLTVQAGPTITSAATAAATDGSAFNFTVKTSGSPAPALSETGALPSGVTFTDNGNGTATLAGTPGLDQGGVYKLTVTAANTFGSATQSFTLTVDQAPAITSASSAPATHGKTFSFTFTATGYPLPTVTHTGTVKGLTYTRGTNGTATLSGTPTTAGTYILTITATNSVGAATQTFTLTVS
jgi:hypothetical protein